MKKTMLVKRKSIANFFERFVVTNNESEGIRFLKPGEKLPITHIYFGTKMNFGNDNNKDNKSVTLTDNMYVKKESGLKKGDTLCIVMKDQTQVTGIEFTVTYTYTVKEYDSMLLEIELENLIIQKK